MNTTKTAAIMTAVALAFGATVAPVAEAQTPNLVQGERFTIKRSNGKWTYCTVGYVDTERKIFYTAAHCMRDKEAEAYLNDQRTLLGKPIYEILSKKAPTSLASGDEFDTV